MSSSNSISIESSGVGDGRRSASTTLESPSTSTTSLHSDDRPAEKRPATPPTKFLAVYPHGRAINNRSPMAQSAKRRNSLQSLRSIAHLQHMYTRQGLASKVKPNVLGKAHPALGQIVVDSSMLEETILPKTPLAPSQLPQGPEDTDSDHGRPPDFGKLRQDAHAAWKRCCQKWALSDLLEKADIPDSNDEERDEVDLSELLSVTRITIRCVRNYLLAIPQALLDDSTGDDEASSVTAKSKPAFRRQSSFYCSPRREVGYNSRASLAPAMPNLSKQRSENNLRRGQGAVDSLTSSQIQPVTSLKTTALVRKAALEVLLLLKSLEAGSCERRDSDISLEVSLSDLSLASREESDLRGRCVSLRDFDKERSCVRQYLQLVSFSFGKIKKAKQQDSQIDGQAMIHVSSPWSSYEESQGLRRALDILRAFVHLECDKGGLHLADNNRRPILEALSDGVILCQAFNNAVSASSKPWGTINLCDVNHQEGSWTFRKRHNLTVWTAALKARYGISPAAFDAILVAKGGPTEEWMNMLQDQICKWAHAVAKER